MSEQKRDPTERGGTHWYLPIFEFHPNTAVLLLFFFYVGVATLASEIPLWFSTAQMPPPGAYLGGSVFAAALAPLREEVAPGRQMIKSVA